MKNITFTFRSRNHSINGHNNLSSIKASISHDLRLALGESQKLNHDQSLSSLNKIYTSKNSYPLNEKNKKVASNIILKSAIIPELTVDETTKNKKDEIKKLQNLCSAIRSKFKKYKSPKHISSLFKIIGDPDTSITELEKIKISLNSEPMDRKKQKLNQLDNYIKHRKSLLVIDKPKSIRGLDLSTVIQSQIYKIPNQHGIKNDKISIDDYADFIYKFHSKHLPNHPVLAVVGHCDEPSVIDSLSGTGDHCHAYIDGRNRSTGEYDLILSQIQAAEKILIEKNPDLLDLERSLLNQDTIEFKSKIESNPEYKSLYLRKIEKLNGRYYGRIYQEAMRIEVNEMLLNKHGLNAEFHYKTRLNKSTLIDQKKPIHNRNYSRAAQIVELLRNQELLLEKSIKNLKNSNFEYGQLLIKTKRIYKELESDLNITKESIDLLTEKLTSLTHDSIKLISGKIHEAAYIKSIEDSISELKLSNKKSAMGYKIAAIAASKEIDNKSDKGITKKISSLPGMKF